MMFKGRIEMDLIIKWEKVQFILESIRSKLNNLKAKIEHEAQCTWIVS